MSTLQKVRFVVGFLFGTSVIVGLVGSASAGGGRHKSESAPRPTSSVAVSETLSASGVERGGADGNTGITPGRPLMVSPTYDLDRHGFVAWEDAFPPPGQEQKKMMPVTNESGELIAYFGVGIGWIELDAANDPTFDYEVALRQNGEQIQRVLERSKNSEGS